MPRPAAGPTQTRGLRFQAGVGSVALVMQAQKDLAADSDSEVQALANYAHAQIVFDLAMGRTLEENHISMKEAEAGRVERESAIPTKLPEIKKPEVKGVAR